MTIFFSLNIFSDVPVRASDNTKNIVFIVKFCITDRDKHHQNLVIFFNHLLVAHLRLKNGNVIKVSLRKP